MTDVFCHCEFKYVIARENLINIENKFYIYPSITVDAICDADIFKQFKASQVVWRLAHKHGFSSHLSFAIIGITFSDFGINASTSVGPKIT